MNYHEQIKEIIAELMPSFHLLGIYAFQGEGDPSSVVEAFVKTYEGYQKARTLTKENFGTTEVNLADGQTLCEPEGGKFGGDNPQMDAAYHMAKQMGMLPPQLMAMLPDLIMEMNHFFIGAQNL